MADSILSGSDLQNLWVAQPDNTGLCRRCEVDGTFTAADRQHNIMIDVGVGLEAD